MPRAIWEDSRRNVLSRQHDLFVRSKGGNSHMANCQERGCPRPAQPGHGLCSYHIHFFDFHISLTDSTLEAASKSSKASVLSAVLGRELRSVDRTAYFPRYSRLWDSEGRCPGCGAARDQATKYCSLCLADNRALKRQVVAAGLCQRCWLPRNGGRILCLACYGKASRCHRRRYANRRASGICAWCGVAKTSSARCERCAQRIHERLLRKFSEGRCVQCGRVRDRSAKRCSACLITNRQYRKKRLALGLCPGCCGPKPEGRTSCPSCSKRVTFLHLLLRRRWRANGLCTTCGHQRDVPNRQQCINCRNKVREAASRCAKAAANGDALCVARALKRRKYSREYMRQRLARLRARGLCAYCGRFAAPRGTLCSSCRDVRRGPGLQSVKKLYKLRKAKGVCTACGKINDTRNIECSRCATKRHHGYRNRFLRRKANGLCQQCGLPKDTDRVTCKACIAKSRESKISRYRRLRETGICQLCKRPSGGRVYCTGCNEKKYRNKKLLRRARIKLHQCPDCGVSLGKADNRLICAKCRTRFNAAYRARRQRVPAARGGGLGGM